MLEVSIPIAYELLAQCIKQGEALVQRASLVGDFSDYESWKAARKQWIDPTTQALSHMYGGPREARDFADTATCPEEGGRWQEQYSADVDCVERAIELLKLQQGELTFDARRAESEEAAERRDELDVVAHATPERRDEPDAVVHATPDGRDEPNAVVHPARERRDEPDAVVRSAQEQLASAAVGAELAPRAPLASAELAQQPSVAVPAEPVQTSTPEPARTRKVLLAHGRDERWRAAVEHLLERAGTHELTILDERPDERARLFERADADPRRRDGRAARGGAARRRSVRRHDPAQPPALGSRAGPAVLRRRRSRAGARRRAAARAGERR